MKILAFDTSSTALSVALLEDENLVAEATVTVKKNHSISLMPTIDFLVAQVSWQPADLDRVVVAQGPGSYTGLRVAVATAKTLAYALDIDLVGVSSLQALTDLSVDGVVIPSWMPVVIMFTSDFMKMAKLSSRIVMLPLQMFLSKLKLLKR